MFEKGFKSLFLSVFTGLFLVLILFDFKILYALPIQEEKAGPVIVTAEKREQNLQEVPVSISVIDENRVEGSGVMDVKDIINIVPNLSISSQNQGVSYIGCRGISPNMLNRRNPFVMYVDGVPFSNITGYNADLNNIESIEVLRGPQGTLYGKNAMGGVMNIKTKSPSNLSQGKISLDISQNETYGVKASSEGAIKEDRLFFSLSASEYQTRGYMKNDSPDEDYYDERDILKLRGRLRWTPWENLEVNLFTGNEKRQGGDGPMIGDSRIRYNEYKNPDDHVDIDSLDNAVHVRLKTEKFDIVSTSTHKKTTEDYDVDYSYGSRAVTHGVLDSKNTTLSQELRIQSPDKRNKSGWMIGFYYENDKEEDNEMSMEYLPNPMMNFNRKTNWPTITKGKTMAVFAQTTIPFWKSFSFTAGLRYENVKKEMDYKRVATNLDTGRVLSRANYSIEDDWNDFTPKVALDYKINGNIMTYISFSRGYLAGGFNNTIDDPKATTYDPQISTSYEWGAKTSWLSGRLIANLALFYMDIEDMQVTEYPSAFIMVASNAGSAHSYGGELEVNFRPFNGLLVYGSLGLINGEYDDYKGYGGVDYSGNELKNTPKYSFNAGAQYRHTSGFYSGLDIMGYGETYFDESNKEESKRDPYEIVNLKLGYEIPGWDFYVYGKNILDEEYFSSIFNSGIRDSYMVGSPRSFGINIVRRF